MIQEANKMALMQKLLGAGHSSGRSGFLSEKILLLSVVIGLFLLGPAGITNVRAQGAVTDVSVTTSASSVNITVTAPNPTNATFGASATTGSPQPGDEWQVSGGPAYSWSAAPGTVDPATGPETTVSAPFSAPGTYTATVTCIVSYSVVKTDGSNDTGTITGQGSASVTVNVGVVWDEGLPLGKKFGKDANGNSVILDDGRITAPQNTTANPIPPVYVLGGTQRACGTETATSLAHKSWPLDDDSHQDYEKNPVVFYSWSCSGGEFIVGTDAAGNPIYKNTSGFPSPTWVAPSGGGIICVITCTRTDAPPAIVLPDTGTRGPKSHTFTCNVIVPLETISVRRMGALKPDPNHPGQTLPVDFSSTATIAAGGLSSNEHKADVRIALTLQGGLPVPQGNDFPDFLPAIIGYKGVSKDATFAITNTTTDATGCLYGTYTSSDMVTSTLNINAHLSVAPSIKLSGSADGQSASIVQRWDDNRMWSTPVYFKYDDPSSQGNSLTFYPTFNDPNTPTTPISIQQDTTSVAISSLDVWQWNGTDYVENPNTLPDDVPGLAWFAPGQASDQGNGAYNYTLHVVYDPYNVVDYISFDPQSEVCWFSY